MRLFAISDPAIRSRLTVILTIATALLGVALDASAQIDLTGRWRLPGNTPSIYADIVQSGTSVSVTWTQDRGFGLRTNVLTGTFDQTTLVATEPGIWSMTMQEYDSGDVLDGTILTPFDSLFHNFHIHFARCECYDGNEVDGDGCSSICRVEPCFSCTAEPSVCAPSPDTATCDDRNDCTIGETCSAGICAAGSPVSPCVNLDGLWTVSAQVPGFEIDDVSDHRYLQRNGFVTVVGASQGEGDSVSSVGTIDTESGEMSLVSRGGQAACMVVSDFAGTASLDNLTFSGSGFRYAVSMGGGGCAGFTQNQQGVRFPNASVPSFSSWGWIAVTLILLALGLLWQTGNKARPRS